MVSSFTEKELDKRYRKAFAAAGWEPESDVLDPDEIPESEDMDESTECLQMLEAVQNDCAAVDPETTLEAAPENPEDPELAPILDKEDFKKIVTSDDKNVSDGTFLPTTLQQALDMCAGKGDFAFWNSLLRLVIKLRCANGGCDTGFVRNGWSCRRASKDLNWYQQLGFESALLLPIPLTKHFYYRMIP